MAKVNYYLKNAPSEEKLLKLKGVKANQKTYNDEINAKRPVIISISFNGKREIFATGKFASLRFWNKETKRVKPLIGISAEMLSDGEWLDAKKNEIEKYLSLANKEYRRVGKDELSELINGKIKVSKEIESFSEVLENFLANHKTQRGASIHKNTKKTYRSFCGHFIKYQKSDLFSPNQYTTAYVKKFKDYLMYDAKLCDNTVSKYINKLKTFFNHLKKEGKIKNLELNDISVAEKEQIVIALTQEELKILMDLKFTNPSHEEVRDIFLFQLYTGGRFSDIENFKRGDISAKSGKKIWNYNSTKTKDDVSAPIHNKAQAILDKYLNLETPLPQYTNQEINREIKKIAKEAKLDRIVRLRKYYDNIPKITYHPLHEIIATHMARKSFISISLQKKVDERIIKLVSGHKDDRSFRRYVTYNNLELETINKVWNKF